MGYKRERVISIKNPLHQSLMGHYKGSKSDIQAKVPLLFYLHVSLVVFLVITAVLVILLTPAEQPPFLSFAGLDLTSHHLGLQYVQLEGEDTHRR